MKKIKLVALLCVICMALAVGSGCSQTPEGGENMQDYYITSYYFPNWAKQDDRDRTFIADKESEWGGTKSSIPRFEGHYAPPVPIWGYEDAADPAVMSKKIEAASSHGIDAFIFCWYWFAEQREVAKVTEGTYLAAELERGFLQADNSENMEFALVWCNHDVGRNIGTGKLSPDEFEKMTDYIVENYFSRPNAMKIDGKLYFSIYNLQTFVEQYLSDGRTDIRLAKEALDRFREKTRNATGLEMHINAVGYTDTLNVDYSAVWPTGMITDPDWTVQAYLGIDSMTSYNQILDLRNYTDSKVMQPDGKGATIDYETYMSDNMDQVELMVNRYAKRDYPFYPTALPGIDYTIRISRYQEWNTNDMSSYLYSPVLIDNTPEAYERILEKTRDIMDRYEINIASVGCWNEWGEGNCIEPNDKYGYGYLQAIKQVFGLN